MCKTKNLQNFCPLKISVHKNIIKCLPNFLLTQYANVTTKAMTITTQCVNN